MGAAVGPEEAPVLERSTLDALTAHVAVINDRGTILLVNDAWDRFAHDNGGSAVGVGVNYFTVCESAADEPMAATVLAGLQGLLAKTATEFSTEYSCHSPTIQRWFRVSARLLPDTTEPCLLLLHEDVTARHRLQDDVHARSFILDEVGAAVVATDMTGEVTLWTRGAERLYGWTAAQAVGQPLQVLVVPVGREHQDNADQVIRELLTTGTAEADLFAARSDGTIVPVHSRCSLLNDAAGIPVGTVAVTIDVSERLATERTLGTITDAIGDGLCILDRAGRIVFVNPPGLRLLRLSMVEAVGGSFMQWVHSAEQAPAWTTHVDAVPAMQCQLVRRDGTEVAIEYVESPLGSRAGGGPGEVLVVFRDVTARREREVMLADQEHSAAWLSRIATSLQDNGFVLHGQPVVDLTSGRTVEHELLLRMRDPEQPDVLITPNKFLPTAEAFGLAPAIDRWVLTRGLFLAARGFPVAINLSAVSLDDSSLPAFIEEMMIESGARPSDVVFEVTETALMGDPANARRFTHLMHDLGCRLALDDFGTGYGGFVYLKNMPVDILKIDIEFVRDALVNPASRHVISAVVGMARSFGMTTVAEGVENEETLTLLRERGVDHAQGYWLGRPGPIDVLSAPHDQETPS